MNGRALGWDLAGLTHLAQAELTSHKASSLRLAVQANFISRQETGEAHDKEQNKQVHTVLSDPKQLSPL
ncbi:hypothetical protein AV530_014130 [Patagioenas fasciata monilis]|uniref:Uncharacterized protein n=1 Tax=Patagioenas fasciata monilis TaxID=372326 RepID=A0A1V4KD15_PATFA|nr:hypothetical protein AV530_014130 [Patagioenas fasciata monilis]